METFIVYLTLFLVTLIGTNFLLGKTTIHNTITKICPQKDSFVKLINSGNHNEQLLRTIKEYSMIKIQNGHYEYDDVLKSLIHKGMHHEENSKRKNEIHA